MNIIDTKNPIVYPKTMDVRIWTEEYMKVISQNPSIVNDYDFILGLLSNAIMTGYDFGKKDNM